MFTRTMIPQLRLMAMLDFILYRNLSMAYEYSSIVNIEGTIIQN
jgi:hypothetical protein